MIRYFESYEVLFLLLGLSCLQLFLKGVSYLLFQRLIWEAERMGKTEEHWFRAMKTKFEAYYKLQLGVHNVVNFVEHYLYQYKYLAVSLQTWENIGLYLMAAHIGLSGILCLMAGYYGMSGMWFYITGCVVLILLCIQGAAELFLDTHRGYCILRVELIDYMENTMRAKLENSSFHQDAMRDYQMEYFRPVSEQKNNEDLSAAQSKSDAGSSLMMHQVEPEPLDEQAGAESFRAGMHQVEPEPLDEQAGQAGAESFRAGMRQVEPEPLDEQVGQAGAESFRAGMHQAELELLDAYSGSIEPAEGLSKPNLTQSVPDQPEPETEKLLSMLAATKEDAEREAKSEKEKLFEQILSDYM